MEMSSKTHWSLASAALGIYLLFSLAYLNLPGLECDEALFVNPLLGHTDGAFVEWHLSLGRLDIPIMLMRYIGAVKSYLYAPIFALFGTGIIAVRLPVVLLGLATLGFTYAAVRAILGREVALLSFILLACDPSFIFANRLDWGPISLMMVLKTAALYFLWRWLSGGSLAVLAWSCFLLGVGLFDKVVFAWFIGALALAFPICYWPQIRPRLNRRMIILALFCLIVGCLPLLVYNIRFPLLTFKDAKIVTTSWSGAVAYRYRLVRNTLAGSEILSWINMQYPIRPAETYWRPPTGALDSAFTAVLRLFPIQRSLTPIAFVLSLALILASFVRGQIRHRQRIFFFVLMVVFISGFICLTAQATGAHHVIMLYPFVHVLIAYAGWEILRLAEGVTSNAWRRLARGCAGCAVGLVLIAPVVLDMGYIKAFKVTGGAGRWSDAIYRLDAYLKKNPEKRFFLMDWGFGPQLLALKSGKVHWEETYSPIRNGKTELERIELLYPYLIDPENPFVFHMPKFATYPILDAFRTSLERYGLNARVTQVIFQKDGKPIYFVCQAVPPSLDLQLRLGKYFYFREGEDYDACSRPGLDFKPTASRRRALGNFWGQNANDFAIYRWSTDREIDNLTLRIRYSTNAPGPVRIDTDFDGRSLGTFELEHTGGFGYKSSDWKVAKLRLDKIGQGQHELRLQALAAGRPVNIDYFYLAEGDFEFDPPIPVSAPAASTSDPFANLEVLGFKDRPDVRLEACPAELFAGKGTLSLRIVNLEASAIDVFYSLEGRNMPIVHNWQLGQDHAVSVPVSESTPKGRYVFSAIRDSHDPSPTGWISTDASVVVK